MQKQTVIKAGKIAGWTLVGIVGTFALLLLAYFLLFRPPVESFSPVAWSPEPGFTVPADKLDDGAVKNVRDFVDEPIQGPEDIVVDAQNRVYTGTQDGKIMRILPTGEVETFADTGGRPLGLVFDAEGNLLVANHGLGLQRISPQGEVTTLTDEANDAPIYSANDVAVAKNGMVYMSDSTPRYNTTTLPGLASYSLYDFLEGRPTGRIIQYNPATDETREIVSDLYFPNGILLSEDEASLLVAESTRFRISQHGVSGEKRGERTVFMDNVPGILDGMTRDEQGQILLPMYNRVAFLERFIMPTNFARELMVRVPSSIIGAREPLAGSILVTNKNGEVLRQMTGFHPSVSNAIPYGDNLLFGTLEGDRMRVMPRL